MSETTVAIRPKGGIAIQTASELHQFACAVVDSNLAPSGFKTPEQVFIAVQMGLELGMQPMQALRSFAVINGKPTLYGDALPALVLASGKLEYFVERFDGTGEETAAVCITKRKDQSEPRETRFTVAMAKRAKLWGKSGPWSDYPQRMLQMRARAWNFRDNFADVLSGMAIAEEVGDFTITSAPATANALPQPVAGESIADAINDADDNAPTAFDLLVEHVAQHNDCGDTPARDALRDYCTNSNLDPDNLSSGDVERIRVAIEGDEITV